MVHQCDTVTNPNGVNRTICLLTRFHTVVMMLSKCKSLNDNSFSSNVQNHRFTQNLISLHTMRSPRRSNRHRRGDSSLCISMDFRSVLISLLLIWLCAVMYFVVRLSSTPTVHKPPALFQNQGHSQSASSIASSSSTLSDLSNLRDRPSVPIHDGDENANSESMDSAQQMMLEITRKLNGQSHLPKEQRRIWSDLKLPELPFKQNRSVHEMVKQQFKNAEWKPKVEMEAMQKSTKKPTKHPTPSPVTTKERTRYECLYYCDSPRDRECVLRHIEYWLKPHDEYESDPDKKRLFLMPSPVLNADYPSKSEGFVTFKSDCGGFNNLRQAYEFIIGVSWLTQRTLVFPVTEGWYLIDWGKVQIEPPPDESGKSNYPLFYDQHHLEEAVAVMNLTDFLLRFQGDDTLDLPQQFWMDIDAGKDTEHWEWRTRQDFKKWQNHRSVNLSFAAPYGINHNVLMWPSKRAVEESKTSKFGISGHPALSKLIGHRKQREYFSADSSDGLSDWDYIHFPSCIDGEMTNYRYLGQVATAIAFADFEVERKYKKLLRDHSHFVPAVFEIASFFISYLGLFEFTSCHIRRNDFQFKNSWVPTKTSFQRMEPFFDSKRPEVIYIASDAEKGFFDGVTEQFDGIKAIYRWRDFVEEDGKLYKEFKDAVGDELNLNEIPRKLVHLIEMVIASAGKRFFGTTSSTYSAYIRRLRGYIDAPDQGIYFHDKKTVVDMTDLKRYRPTEYMIEFPEMWMDIKDYC